MRRFPRHQILGLAISVSALCIAASALAQDGQSIRMGQTVSGSISTSDPRDAEDVFYDGYRFQAGSGDRLLVTLTSDDFDAFLQVGREVDGSFHELAYNDDDGVSLNSRLVFTVPDRGTYVIRARPLGAGETGTYRLTLGEAPPLPSARGLSVGDSLTGNLSSASTVNDSGFRGDLYRVDLQPGQRIEILVGSDDFDTYVVLYDAAGYPSASLAFDDDGAGMGTNSRLRYSSERGGVHLIEVRGFIQRPEGEYTLSVAEIAPERAAESLAYGQVLEGRIDADDPTDAQGRGYDSYVFSGVGGNRVQITARSGDFDIFLQIGSASGEFLALASDDDGLGEGTDSRLNFTLPEDGDYMVRVMPLFADNTGLYSLELADRGPAPAPGSILVGATARGTLDENDALAADNSHYDAYRVQAKAGEVLVITMVSNNFDAFLIVARETAADNIEVLSSDDDGLSDTHARVEWTVPSDGTYVIRAGSYAAGETGDYTLIVERRP